MCKKLHETARHAHAKARREFYFLQIKFPDVGNEQLVSLIRYSLEPIMVITYETTTIGRYSLL